MVKSILLACAGGFSTSMLVERMRGAAREKQLEVEIDAIGEGKIDRFIDTVDVLLLGPQISHLETDIKQRYGNKDVVIKVINSMDYGMMNGEKILNEALASK